MVDCHLGRVLCRLGFKRWQSGLLGLRNCTGCRLDSDACVLAPESKARSKLGHRALQVRTMGSDLGPTKIREIANGIAVSQATAAEQSIRPHGGVVTIVGVGTAGGAGNRAHAPAGALGRFPKCPKHFPCCVLLPQMDMCYPPTRGRCSLEPPSGEEQ